VHEASSKLRSAIGTFIFLCVATLVFYKTYFVVYLTYLVYFDHSKNYDLVLPGPLEWAFGTLYLAAILITLVRKWRWSTVPLWSLTLVLLIVGIVLVRNPEITIDKGGFVVFLVIPVAIQIAALLRRNYKKDPATL
jgi:K+ transporter